MEQLGNITFWDVKDAFNKVKNVVMNYTEMEAKVHEATNNEPWGASTTSMSDIAQATYNYQHFNEVMTTIYKRFTEKEARYWRQIYKALQLLEYLVKHGSDRVVDDARAHMALLKIMKNFSYIDEKGKDQGINVRNRAKELTELLSDTDRIKMERKKARANRTKYTGVSSESLSFGSASQYRGFGSDSSGGSRGFRDQDDDQSYSRYNDSSSQAFSERSERNSSSIHDRRSSAGTRNDFDDILSTNSNNTNSANNNANDFGKLQSTTFATTLQNQQQTSIDSKKNDNDDIWAIASNLVSLDSLGKEKNNKPIEKPSMNSLTQSDWSVKVFPTAKKSTACSRFAKFVIERQIELPLKIIATVILCYLLNPSPKNPFYRLLFISYPIHIKTSDEILYLKGYWDLGFIFFWLVAFTFIREFTMQYILRPLAIFGKIKNKREITRFMEQGYVVIYCTISSSVGLNIMYNSSYWYFNTKYFWIDYPHYAMTGLVKSYYLIQFAFWLQQIFVLLLQLEKPRKDFLEFIAHHIITCLLIGGSYLFNFTRIGNAVFISMDFSDIWLAFAKCLKYLAAPNIITDSMFGFFMITWAYTRHYLYGYITWATYQESCQPEYNACIWDPLNGYWLTWWSKYIILLGLVLLQILMIYWFNLILKVAWRVIKGKNAEDSRSDVEDDEDDISSENPPNTKKSD
ncbi:480_t:CDS:10 [Entrophospora sp. SA101]|nr:480_t:CDS:10 [Entrophospora sp. SA101]